MGGGMTVEIQEKNGAKKTSAEAASENENIDSDAQDDEVKSKKAQSPEDEVGEQSAFQSEITNLKQELERAEEHLLRARAEMQNVQRRARIDVEKASKFGLEKILKALLPIVDSLEMGVDSIVQEENEQNLESVKEGMNLTLKLFEDTLKQFDVTCLDPHGDAFDPNFHEAISMVPHADVDPNTVIQVIQKGYNLNGRVIRPAKVIVSQEVLS